jgi:DNA-binding response OmpR family regulator
MRVLLAEDEKKVAQHVRAALREQGFTVDIFHRGDEALDAALGTPCDAVLFDTGTNVVEVHIQRLRKKVDDGYDVKLIHTVRDVGYVLKREG